MTATSASPELGDLDDDLNVSPADTGGAPRWPYVEMLISSVLSLVASFVLSVDALVLAANPDAELSCNINTQISCGAVAASWQANLLGFPNAFLGMIAEPVVITIAVLGLARTRFPRWFMVAAWSVYTAGFIFALWLLYQSYFNIHALCPWCLLVTACTTLVWTSMTRIALTEGHLGAGLQRLTAPALRYNVDVIVTVLFLAVIAAAIVYRYA